MAILVASAEPLHDVQCSLFRAGNRNSGDIYCPVIRDSNRSTVDTRSRQKSPCGACGGKQGGPLHAGHREFSNQINGTYPEDKPLSTVPPNILAVLPSLPDDIRYRFLGRHLILLDTRANLILDRMPCAIERGDRDELTCHR
jgi:hypothetical protein